MKLLIVIDMQNDFISGALANYKGAEVKAAVLDKLANWDGLVAATRDTHDIDYLETQEGKKLPVTHCIKGTKGWKMDKDIDKALVKFTKQFSNGLSNWLGYFDKDTFGSKKLTDVLWNLNNSGYKFDEIELCGLVSSICVMANAVLLKTAFPEMPITIDSKCTAGLSPEDSEAALVVFKDLQINVI